MAVSRVRDRLAVIAGGAVLVLPVLAGCSATDRKSQCHSGTAVAQVFTRPGGGGNGGKPGGEAKGGGRGRGKPGTSGNGKATPKRQPAPIPTSTTSTCKKWDRKS
jgi:hypothetical protein